MSRVWTLCLYTEQPFRKKHRIWKYWNQGKMCFPLGGSPSVISESYLKFGVTIEDLNELRQYGLERIIIHSGCQASIEVWI